MINDIDAQFHDTDGNLTWAETNYFGFFNAEENLNIGVYALFRPNLGVVSSTICMNSRRVVAHWESDFCDMQASLPMPKPHNLLDYKLLNSLHVRCLDPNRVWDIHYDDSQGTMIDVRFEALMPAFDIHDPEMDPMVGAKTEEGKFAWGTAYNGHFDLTGQVTGSVTIRGKHTPINCVSTMDHSWGPRPERGKPSMTWLHGHFSKDLAFHAILGFDPQKGGKDLWLAHGYVMEKGQVFGLKAGAGRVDRRQEWYAEHLTLELTDSENRIWKPEARALTTFPWLCWPNMVTYNPLCEWSLNGLTGYGEVMEFIELPNLTALNSDPATRRLAIPLSS
jgi:hypothetical protein